jgi:hypothetical protein
MKLQLDTTNKTIKVEEKVNLAEFTDTLEKLLPNGKWREFELECNTTINWNSPIIVEPYRPYNPYRPCIPWQPWITYTDENTVHLKYDSLVPGVYNIQV